MHLFFKVIIGILVIVLIHTLAYQRITDTIEKNSSRFPLPAKGVESFENSGKKKTEEELTKESLVDANPAEEFAFDKKNSFCELTGSSLAKREVKCKKLTNDNCKDISCCVLLNGNKCVAGAKDGPAYPDSHEFDHYYYEKKCYGKKCPK